MLNVTQKYKGLNLYFATILPNGESNHYVYLSGYGQMAADLLDKYVEDQRADNEELFVKWDELIQSAKSEVGFKSINGIEDGHVYITSFQNGVGISEEDEAGVKRYTARGRKRKTKISIINPELSEGIDDDDDESFDLNEDIDEVDISDSDE